MEELVHGDEDDGNSETGKIYTRKTQKWTWKNTVQMRRSMAEPKSASDELHTKKGKT